MQQDMAGRWRMESLAKRILDIVGAGMGLIVFSPVLGVTALLIWLDLGRPVLYVRLRPGLHTRTFRLYKFRTMTDERGPDERLLPDSQRLTTLGRMIRALSIDELPQLWNVLKGDMSLVGPRPLLVQYLARYTPTQMRRHEVRPGITGWAQVSGRQHVKFSERLQLDVWYVDHWNLWLDLRIVLQTLAAVVRREGVVCGQDVADVDDIGLSERTVDSMEGRKVTR